MHLHPYTTTGVHERQDTDREERVNYANRYLHAVRMDKYRIPHTPSAQRRSLALFHEVRELSE